MPPTSRARGPGRSPSMADVARHAGVSHQTVSRVLNDSPLVTAETRAKVQLAVDALGYRRNAAARLLATNRSHRIGMISAHLAFHGPSMIAVAVQEAGHEAGYDVALVGLSDFSTEALAGAVDRLLDEAVEAIVVAVARHNAVELVRSLDLPVPLVVVQGVSAGEPMAVGIDQEGGAALATGHLLDLGHVSVAQVTGPPGWIEADQRSAGWRRAHVERGLDPGPVLVGDWSARSGYEAGRVLPPGVTAVFAANDAMALGVLGALHEAGRPVPGEVSVVGFDDMPEAAYLWPSLTTVAQDFGALGRQAVALTLQALDGDRDGTATVDLIRPELVARGSSASP